MDPVNPIAGNPEALNQNPQTQTSKDNHGITIAAMALFVLLALGAVAFLYYQNQQLKQILAGYQTQKVSPSPAATADMTAGWKPYTFDPINLTLKVPPELTVNSSSPNGNDFVAYIQNAAFNSGDAAQGYQLYLIWQKLPAISLQSFMGLKADLNPSSIEDTTISGYPAIKGQIKGQRNRFVTYILKDGQKISLFTSQPTDANKILTDQILSTFKFINSTASPSAKPSNSPISSPSANPNINY